MEVLLIPRALDMHLQSLEMTLGRWRTARTDNTYTEAPVFASSTVIVATG